jgi:hypothetical protein
MRHIKSIILKKLKTFNKKTLNNTGIIDSNMVCRKTEEIIQQKSAEHVEALFYKNKEVFIKCFNPIIANELRLFQEDIKNEINKFFNKEVLKKIIFKA